MGIRPIILFPHPRLTQPCRKTPLQTSIIAPILKDLLDTMSNSPGVGLAAPQIGIQERISVIDIGRKRRGDKKHVEKSSHSIKMIVLINPVLISGGGEQVPREGCLSVPDFLANVRRYKRVRVKTQTLDKQEKIIEAEGFLALALQHEIDHLNGILFLDRVSNLKTDVFRRKMY